MCSSDLDLIYRASNTDELVLKDELDYLANKSNGALRVHYLVGSRDIHPMSARYISKYVPRFADADVYVCGPKPLVDGLRKACSDAGIPRDRFHDEAFEFHNTVNG